MPYEIEKLQYWQDRPKEALCQIHLISSDVDSLELNMAIANARGQIIAKISSLRLRSYELAKEALPEQKRSIFAIERHWET